MTWWNTGQFPAVVDVQLLSSACSFPVHFAAGGKEESGPEGNAWRGWLVWRCGSETEGSPGQARIEHARFSQPISPCRQSWHLAAKRTYGTASAIVFLREDFGSPQRGAQKAPGSRGTEGCDQDISAFKLRSRSFAGLHACRTCTHDNIRVRNPKLGARAGPQHNLRCCEETLLAETPGTLCTGWQV